MIDIEDRIKSGQALSADELKSIKKSVLMAHLKFLALAVFLLVMVINTKGLLGLLFAVVSLLGLTYVLRNWGDVLSGSVIKSLKRSANYELCEGLLTNAKCKAYLESVGEQGRELTEFEREALEAYKSKEDGAKLKNNVLNIKDEQ